MITETLLNLGRIHWYLVYAASQMDVKCFKPHQPGEIHKVIRTSFGDEVGNDEPHWWVYKKEHDIPALKKKTEIALDAVSKLHHAADKVRSTYYPSTQLLYQAYEALAEEHNNDINSILNYVEWLYSRDILAPIVLFNSRTWSSTRRSDRIIPVKKDDLKQKSTIEKLTLIVLGLIRMGWATIDQLRAEMQVEAFDNRCLDSFLDGNKIRISEEMVESKTANQASHEFENYMEHLRYSLRSLMTEIGNRESQEHLLTSDDFWRSFISTAARSRKTEQKYWDFKETLEMWRIDAKLEKDKKANEFTERVAGFANNQGGVIIVGVTDPLPRQIVGLIGSDREIENRMKTIPQVIQKYISCSENFYCLHQINALDKNGDAKLCLVIAIQQTKEVVSVRALDNKSYSYPFREETGIVYRDSSFILSKKKSVKDDNWNFIQVLQQFVSEEID